MQSSADNSGIAWKPGFLRRAPWATVFSILGFGICCVGLGFVLQQSDGKPVATWPQASQTVPVSVLLSLLVSFANLFIAIALSKGYEISWWLQALRGAEIGKLQFDLKIQHGVSALFSRHMKFDIFAIAALVSLAVSVLDGPLIQRSSTITSKTYQPYEAIMQVNISNASLPANFSSYTAAGPGLLTPLFSTVNRAYSNRNNLIVPIHCDANTTCTLTIPAPGFDVACTEQRVPFDFGDIGSGEPKYNLTIFNVTVTFGENVNVDDNTNYSRINTTVLYKPNEACSGYLIERKCILRLATVEYPVTVNNGTATLGSWSMGQNETIELFRFSNASMDGFDTLFDGTRGGPFKTMLGGIYYVLDALYSTSTWLRFVAMSNTPYVLYTSSQASSNYLSSDISTYSNCSMTWDDPTTDIVNTARQLMFRSALAYSEANPSTMTPQYIKVQQTKVAAAYKSHYEYLAVTVGCMVLQAVIVSFLSLGFHQLGRDMSTDAFEIARALGAPLLQEGSSNSALKEALEPVQHLRVRYGEVLSNGQASHHQLQAQDQPPQSGVIPGNELRSSTHTRGGTFHLGVVLEEHPRLGLVEEARVGEIRHNILY